MQGKELKVIKKESVILNFLLHLSRIIPLAILLSGCRANKEHLWAFGASIFVFYVLALLMILLIPRLHQLPSFHKLAEKIKKPVCALAIFISLVGGGVTVIGIPKFFEDYGPEKLTFFLGTIVLVLGRYLYLWARSDSAEKKTTYAKIVTLSLSFSIGMLYIIGGAEMVKFD